jgi:hypothetical protein
MQNALAHSAARPWRLRYGGDLPLAVAQQTGAWLFGRFEQGLLPTTCFGEVVVGEASLSWTAEEAAEALTALHRRAVALPL